MAKKIKDLFPEMSEFSKATAKLNELTEFVNITKSINETAQSPDIGNDVTMAWGTYGVSQGPARIQTLREFMRLFARVTEIRAPVQHVTSEVFRRGITWKPRFVIKCEKCETEYEETKNICEKCGSESLVKPDEKQKERFNLYLNDANIFDNSFEEILKAFNINLSVLDDAILYLHKEYIGNDVTGSIRSKIIEIRNISPADVDFDLDAQGLPKNSHFICYLHRDDEITSIPGNCSKCGRKLIPTMYILHYRGKNIYLTDVEIIHASRLTPSETWGISPIFTAMDKAMTLIGMDSCYDEETEVLTKDGWKYFKNIINNDLLVTVSQNNHLIEYQNPIHLFSFENKEKAYKIKNAHLDLLVSKNHNMYVKKNGDNNYGIKNVQDIEGQKYRYLRGGLNWEGKEKENFVLPGVSFSYSKGPKPDTSIFNAEDWAEFCGYWFSRGIKSGNERAVLTKRGMPDSVYNCINKLNVKWYEDDKYIGFGNRGIFNELKGYINNRVGLLEKVKTWPSNLQQKFYDSSNISLLDAQSKQNRHIEIKNLLNSFSVNGVNNKSIDKFIFKAESNILTKTLDNLSIPMDIWLEFLGYYLSEGSFSKNSKGNIQIAQVKKDTKEIIGRFLNKTPFRWKEIEKGFITYDRRLNKYLSQFGHAKDKFIPLDLLELSKKQLNILFEALMLGDGSEGRKYITVSPKLRDQVMEIALKLGYGVSYSIKFDDRNDNWNECYIVNISKKQLETPVNLHKKEDKWVDYSGKMYCAEVPNHTLIVRRNGKVVVSSNSLYNYFFNRKMPASMIMVFTDDPESVRKAQKEMENKTRQDNNYIPMVAVSSRNQRGRVDMVRLFHTLQEMEYLPVRQEIRERLAELWGVTPVWQASSESSGGMSGQQQQLVVMSRVVEGYQRIYHEKVFPKILYAFGITDWMLYLPQPEEKSEQTRIAFAQQRTAIASQLHNMGFTVDIRSKGSSVDDIDFIVSGKALNPQQAMFGGTNPTGTEGIGGGESTPPIALSSDVDTQQRGWINQIISSGYTAPTIKYVNKEGNRVYFVMNGKDYVSSFDGIGKLIKIEEIPIQRLIQTQPVIPKYIPKKPLENDYFEEE